jgi:hypothetical protein
MRHPIAAEDAQARRIGRVAERWRASVVSGIAATSAMSASPPRASAVPGDPRRSRRRANRFWEPAVAWAIGIGEA